MCVRRAHKCVCECAHACAFRKGALVPWHKCGSERTSLWEWVLAFSHVRPKDQTQVCKSDQTRQPVPGPVIKVEVNELFMCANGSCCILIVTILGMTYNHCTLSESQIWVLNSYSRQPTDRYTLAGWYGGDN